MQQFLKQPTVSNLWVVFSLGKDILESASSHGGSSYGLSNLVSVISATLTGVMGARYSKGGAMAPGGIAAVSLLMSLFYLYR
jgi:hypothetical protein